MRYGEEETIELAWGDQTLVLGTGAWRTVRLTDWDYPPPGQRPNLGESPDGSQRYGDNAYEDRTITLTIDPSSGNVPGDPLTGLVTNYLSWNTTSSPGNGKRELVPNYALPTALSSIDGGGAIRATSDGRMRVRIFRRTASGDGATLATQTVMLKANRWTRVALTGVQVGPPSTGASTPIMVFEPVTSGGAPDTALSYELKDLSMGLGGGGAALNVGDIGTTSVPLGSATPDSLTRPANGVEWQHAVGRALTRAAGGMGLANSGPFGAATMKRTLPSGRTISFQILSAQLSAPNDLEAYMGFGQFTLTLTARPFGFGAPRTLSGAWTRTSGIALWTPAPDSPVVEGDVPAWTTVAPIAARAGSRELRYMQVKDGSAVNVVAGSAMTSAMWGTPASTGEGVYSAGWRSGPLPLGDSEPQVTYTLPSTTAGTYELFARVKAWAIATDTASGWYGLTNVRGVVYPTTVALLVNGRTVAQRNLPIRIRPATGASGAWAFWPWRVLSFGQVSLRSDDEVSLQFTSGMPTNWGATGPQGAVDYLAYIAAERSAQVALPDPAPGKAVFGDTIPTTVTGSPVGRVGTYAGTWGVVGGTTWANAVAGVGRFQNNTGGTGGLYLGGPPTPTAPITWMQARFALLTIGLGQQAFIALQHPPQPGSQGQVQVQFVPANSEQAYVRWWASPGPGDEVRSFDQESALLQRNTLYDLTLIVDGGLMLVSIVPQGRQPQFIYRVPVGVAATVDWRPMIGVQHASTEIAVYQMRAGTGRSTPPDSQLWWNSPQVGWQYNPAPVVQGDYPALLPGRRTSIALLVGESDFTAPTSTPGVPGGSVVIRPRYLQVPDE